MKNYKTIPNNITVYKNIFDETVRWGDTDGYNHVNNVSISRYFESARVNIIRNLESKKYSFVIVNFSINYLNLILQIVIQVTAEYKYNYERTKIN